MKMTQFAVLGSLCFLAATRLASAQNTPPPAASVAVQTLAQALAQAKVPANTIYLAVAAEKVTPPKDADSTPLPPGDPVPQVAGAYGRLTQAWESVTAIAPPTMTTVYAPPDTPNPYDGMPVSQVLKLLTATFTKDQWKVFFGKSGLGFQDLQTDPQRSLFMALFSGGHLIVQKDLGDPKAQQDITGDALLQIRLRLGYIVDLALPMRDNPESHLFAGGPDLPGMPTRYYMMNGQTEDVDHELGATVRETVPNALKAGDLDFDPLTASVPLGGVKTVDDLVARIGVALHRELYADARYGARTVTLVGTPKTAKAKDLLRALALCVCGTYRKVGPSFVLTDDLVGLGARHALWKEFEDKAQAMLPQDDPAATSPYTIQDIPWDPADPLAPTQNQQKQIWTARKANPVGGGIVGLTVPFAGLTPAQQEQARLLQADHEEHNMGTTLDGTVTVQSEAMLEMTLPSLDGPVIVFQSYQGLLPEPHLSAAEQAAQQAQFEARLPDALRRETPTLDGSLRPLVEGFVHRAVRLAPQSAAELARALTAMKALGFNELWLEVTPGPTRRDDDAALALLAQAGKAGQADGITVLPDVHLLRWAAGTPAALWDRDILGRTAVDANKSARYPSPDASDTVSPFSPEVWDRLSALIRAAGATPGIGGMVWEDLPPAGYQDITPGGMDMSGLSDMPLGFTEAGRLALLRAAHADPVDVYTTHYTDERANIRVPGFDAEGEILLPVDGALYNRWRLLRAKTVMDLARHLASLLPPPFLTPGAARRPVLLPPANESSRSPKSQYGSWDDFRRPLPLDVFVPLPGPAGQGGTTGTMKMTTALNYGFLRFSTMTGETTSDRRENVVRTLRYARSGGNQNVVLDLTQAPGLLDALTAAESAKSTTVSH